MHVLSILGVVGGKSILQELCGGMKGKQIPRCMHIVVSSKRDVDNIFEQAS